MKSAVLLSSPGRELILEHAVWGPRAPSKLVTVGAGEIKRYPYHSLVRFTASLWKIRVSYVNINSA